VYYTGFADEAAPDISGQIRATKELGWEFIEARNIGGRNIHDITDAEFDDVCGRLSDAGVRINCFGSAIANWAKQVTEPFDSSLEEARRAIPRMRRLGAGLVRVMSLGVLRDRPPTEQMEPERFRRLRELVAMFAAEGITPVHENCANYGGMGAEFTLRMLDAVPGLGLVFDTGNPVFTPDYSKPEPRPRQSAWEFYERVRDRIDYVHVKDGVFVRDTPGSIFPEATFTFPGQGNADLRRIVADLLAHGYDGGFSMEPHISVVYHRGEGQSDDEARFGNYVEFGRQFMRMVEECRPAAR